MLTIPIATLRLDKSHENINIESKCVFVLRSPNEAQRKPPNAGRAQANIDAKGKWEGIFIIVKRKGGDTQSDNKFVFLHACRIFLTN